MTVHFQDGESDTLDRNTVSNLGQSIQMSKNHPAYGRHPGVFNAKVGQGVEIGQLHGTRHFIFIVVLLFVEFLAGDFARDLAENEGQYIFHCHDTFHTPEFVKHCRCTNVVCLEKIKYLVNLLGRRHNNRRVHDVYRLQNRQFNFIHNQPQDVLRMDKTHQVVSVALKDRHPGMLI